MDVWIGSRDNCDFITGAFMNFKQMRENLAAWGISAPESDEELGYRWDYYANLLHRKMNPLAGDN